VFRDWISRPEVDEIYYPYGPELEWTSFGGSLALRGEELFVSSRTQQICAYRKGGRGWREARCYPPEGMSWGRRAGPFALSGDLLAVGSYESGGIEAAIFRITPQGLVREAAFELGGMADNVAWAGEALAVAALDVRLYRRGSGAWHLAQTLPYPPDAHIGKGRGVVHDQGLLAVASVRGSTPVVDLYAERGTRWVEVKRLPGLFRPVMANGWLAAGNNKGIALYEHTREEDWVLRQTVQGSRPWAMGDDWLVVDKEYRRSLMLYGRQEKGWALLSEVVIPVPPLALRTYGKVGSVNRQLAAVSDGRWVYVSVVSGFELDARCPVPSAKRAASAVAVYEIVRSDGGQGTQEPGAR